MRILLVVHGYPPDDLGGTEVHTATVARELAARGHAVSVLAAVRRNGERDASVVDRVDDGVAVRRISAPRHGDARPALTDPWVRKEFERLVDETDPDVVHVQHLMHLSGDLIGAAKDRAVPTVVTLHDLWFQCPAVHPSPHAWHPPGRGWGLGCLVHHGMRTIAVDALRRTRPRPPTETLRRPGFLRRQLDLADAILAPSRYIVDAFVRFGVAPDKLRLIPHGVTVRPPVRERFAPATRFGFVGSLVPTKGVHVLCDAFRRVDDDSSLHIYGPAYGTRYLRRIRSYLGPRVRVEGEFAHEDAARVYGSFDVLVLPSLVPESFGLAASEAHAYGVPVIASSIGALSERVAHDRDGLLVPPGDVDALAQALARLKDPATVRRLAAGIAAPRSMGSYVDELESVYDRVFPRHSRPAVDDPVAVSEVQSRG